MTVKQTIKIGSKTHLSFLVFLKAGDLYDITFSVWIFTLIFLAPNILEFMNISGLGEVREATGHLQPTVHVSGIPNLYTSIACWSRRARSRSCYRITKRRTLGRYRTHEKECGCLFGYISHWKFCSKRMICSKHIAYIRLYRLYYTYITFTVSSLEVLRQVILRTLTKPECSQVNSTGMGSPAVRYATKL